MRLTLSAYIRQRNGVALGTTGSLINTFRSSLGAGTFARFWRYWHPIWGYGLARFVYAPLLKRGLPNALATVLTFVVCGALHDLAILRVRAKVTLLLTCWFFLLGLVVVQTTWAGWDFTRQHWSVRATVNISYVAACLALSIYLRRVLGVV